MSLNDLPGERPRQLGLSVPLYLGIVRVALMERPKEMCGLLVVDPMDRSLWRSMKFAQCRNTSDKPGDSFTIDPEDHKRLSSRYRVVGMVHSHPNGEARPSDWDKETWVPNRSWYVVVGMMEGQPRVGCSWVEDGEFILGRLVVRQMGGAETPWRHGHPLNSCINNRDWHMVISRRLDEGEWDRVMDGLHSIDDAYVDGHYDAVLVAGVVQRVLLDVTVRVEPALDPRRN